MNRDDIIAFLRARLDEELAAADDQHLQALAAIHRTHPDYRHTWTPAEPAHDSACIWVSPWDSEAPYCYQHDTPPR
ncbi:hypothetical protein ACIBKY_51100 [Nonomuraea sp. NPDC050394]|uniref:hypothetical protein n=1 Tax=Nonomuraea sp. NPDC050394 TaxID=3364363 RepID=UPI00378F7A88